MHLPLFLFFNSLSVVAIVQACPWLVFNDRRFQERKNLFGHLFSAIAKLGLQRGSIKVRGKPLPIRGDTSVLFRADFKD